MANVIVTGVDGSETAGIAATKAADLAALKGAQLHVLSAFGKFEEDTFSSGTETVVFNSEKDAEHTIATTVAELRRLHPTLEITAAPSEGKPGEALVKAAERLEAELIVVGNKRVQGFGRILGSIARDVASKAPCDVYVAHTHQV